MANYFGHKRHSPSGISGIDSEGGDGEGETPMLVPLKRLRLDDELQKGGPAGQQYSPLETQPVLPEALGVPSFHLAYPDSVEFPDDDDGSDDVVDSDEDTNDVEGSEEEGSDIGIVRFKARGSGALSWREKRRRKRNETEGGFGNGKKVRFVLPDEFNLKNLPSVVYPSEGSPLSGKLFPNSLEQFNSNPLAMVLYVPRHQILPDVAEPPGGGPVITERSEGDDQHEHDSDVVEDMDMMEVAETTDMEM